MPVHPAIALNMLPLNCPCGSSLLEMQNRYDAALNLDARLDEERKLLLDPAAPRFLSMTVMVPVPCLPDLQQ